MRTITKAATTLFIVVLALTWSASAQAQSRHGRRVIVAPRAYVYAPFVYDAFWGPFYYPYGYPYGGFPYDGYRSAGGSVKVQVVPKQAEVFVDGYYAGTADDFDGMFKHLETTPGGHAITLHLEGYRTVTRNVYVRPGSTFKILETMEKVPAGAASDPPPLSARRVGQEAPPRRRPTPPRNPD